MVNCKAVNGKIRLNYIRTDKKGEKKSNTPLNLADRC